MFEAMIAFVSVLLGVAPEPHRDRVQLEERNRPILFEQRARVEEHQRQVEPLHAREEDERLRLFIANRQKELQREKNILEGQLQKLSLEQEANARALEFNDRVAFLRQQGLARQALAHQREQADFYRSIGFQKFCKRQ